MKDKQLKKLEMYLPINDTVEFITEEIDERLSLLTDLVGCKFDIEDVNAEDYVLIKLPDFGGCFKETKQKEMNYHPDVDVRW